MNDKVYKYGIDITNATLQTYAYELGLEKTVTEMTQMEKQQLRVLAILDQSEVAFGDLANTINSPSNQIRQLTNNLEQCGIVLGQLFMPIVEKVLPVVNGLSIAIRQLLVDMSSLMGVSIDFDEYGEGFDDTEDVLDAITDSLDEATESAKSLKKQLQGFDKLNVITTSSTSGTNGTDTSTIDLTEQIVAATDAYQKAWDEAYAKMENKAQIIAETITSFFVFDTSAIDFSGLEKSFTTLTGFSFDALQSFYDNFLSPLIDWEMSESIPNLVEIFNTLVSGIDWNGIIELMSNWFSIAEKVSTAIISAWQNIIKEILPYVTPIINDIVDAFNSVLEAVEPIWNIVEMYILPMIEQRLIKVITNLLNVISFTTSVIKTKVGGISDFITGVFSGDWEKAWGGVSKTFTAYSSEIFNRAKDMGSKIKETLFGENGSLSKLANTLSSAWEKAINTIKNIWNNFANWINDKLTIKIDTSTLIGKGLSTVLGANEIKLANLPTYQTGGFPEDGLFFANHNELVGQFSNGKTAVANNEQIVDSFKQGVKEAVSEILAPYLADIADSSRKTANKNFGITSREAFSAVRTEASNYTRRTGQPAF